MARRQSSSVRAQAAPGASPIYYKTSLCKFNILGQCTRGAACWFAHESEDLRALPDLFRTKMCIDYLRSGGCKEGDDCTFAHHKSELRMPIVQSCGTPPRAGAAPARGTTRRRRVRKGSQLCNQEQPPFLHQENILLPRNSPFEPEGDLGHLFMTDAAVAYSKPVQVSPCDSPFDPEDDFSRMSTTDNSSDSGFSRQSSVRSEEASDPDVPKGSKQPELPAATPSQCVQVCAGQGTAYAAGRSSGYAHDFMGIAGVQCGTELQEDDSLDQKLSIPPSQTYVQALCGKTGLCLRVKNTFLDFCPPASSPRRARSVGSERWAQ